MGKPLWRGRVRGAGRVGARRERVTLRRVGLRGGGGGGERGNAVLEGKKISLVNIWGCE